MISRLSGRADQLSGDKRHIACSAAQIENSHLATKPRHLEDRARCRRKHPALQIQPLKLGGIDSKLIAALRRPHKRVSYTHREPPSIAQLAGAWRC
jgi:hypothetical protein